MTHKFSLEDLPIFRTLPNIHNFMRENVRGAILGPTGIGKSLGIPASLIRISPNARYVISVPNISTAKFLAYRQRSISPGYISGFADETHPPPGDVQILYATSGYLRDIFFNLVETGGQGTASQSVGNIVFIDEAHLSSTDNYLTIKLWEYLYQNKSEVKIPRLYLLSTSLDKEVYRAFNTYGIKVNSQPIDIKYMSSDYDILSKKRYSDMVNTILTQHIISPKGTFMVFVPGKRDVQHVVLLLEKQLSDKNIKGVMVLRAYGDLNHDEINKIYQPTNDRKVIVATNLFESAITVDNTIAVFDSMLEKRRDGSEFGGLVTTYISKASAIQRAGRTGRTNPGVCYRMCTVDFFNQLEDFRPIDITSGNVPIYSILIKIASIGIPDIITILPSEIRDRTPQAIKFLKNLNMINIQNEITEMGRFYYRSKLSIRASAILWYWLKTNTTNKYAGIVLASIINNYSEGYLFFNMDEINPPGSGLSRTEININWEKYKIKYFSQIRGQSDLHTYMNMWLHLTMHLNANPSVDINQSIKQWSENNRIRYRKVQGLYDNIKILTRFLINEGYTDLSNYNYVTGEIIHEMIPIISLVFSEKQFLKVENYYKLKTDFNKYYLERNYSVNNYKEDGPKKVISFSEYVRPEDRVYKINFSVDVDINDSRIFNYDVLTIESRIPKRANPPDFKGVTTISYIKFNPINKELSFKLKLEEEIPEQGIIQIGQIFPFNE